MSWNVLAVFLGLPSVVMFVHMLPNEDTNMLSVDISVIYSIDTSRCFLIDKAYAYLGPTIYAIKHAMEEQKCSVK